MIQVIGDVHVIEFQKRGLPHAHILLILGDDAPRYVCTCATLSHTSNYIYIINHDQL